MPEAIARLFKHAMGARKPQNAEESVCISTHGSRQLSR
jgi:hypothetical protein